MPDTIQPREYSTGGGRGGILYVRAERQRQPERPVSHRERRAGGSELELARQQLERQQPGSALRHSLHFSLLLKGVFLF